MTDEEKEQIFTGLVKDSWKRFNEHYHHAKVDDVLLGAVVAANVRSGYSLIDLNSDGTNHFLRFENLQDHTRLVFRLHHLAEDLTVAKVQGHLADVSIGYGEKTGDLGAIWSTLKAEMKSMFVMQAEPGIMTFDADLTGGYIYGQIGLLLDLDDYIEVSTFQVDLPKLQSHIGSVVHSLQKYLRGRLAVRA